MMLLIFQLGCVETPLYTASIGIEGPACGETIGLPTSCGDDTCVDPLTNLCQAPSGWVYGTSCAAADRPEEHPPDPCQGCSPPAAPCGDGWCGKKAFCTEGKQCRLLEFRPCQFPGDTEDPAPVFDSPACPEFCRPVE